MSVHRATASIGQTDKPPVPTVMHAVVLDGVGFDHLRLRSVPTPQPGPRQILARVDAAGICTSLIKLIEQGGEHNLMHGWDPARYPIILGDEGCVTLVEVGHDLLSSYQPGQRYVVQPAVDHAPINHRERYRNEARGVNKLAAGYTLPGHLAEYMLIPEEVLEAGCLLPLPKPDIPYAHAALSEPLSCIVSAQEHHLHLVQKTPLSERTVVKGLKPGGVTVIVGAGPMGRMHIDLALSYRPRLLIVADRHDEKLGRVRELFAARAEQLAVKLLTVNPNVTDVRSLVEEQTDYRGADDVIVSVGTRQAIESSQSYVGRGGVLNLFGGLKRGDDLVALDSSSIHYKEINITGSSGGSPWDVARTLELIASGGIDPANHITRIGSLDQAVAFIRMVKDKEMNGKAVVYPHQPVKESIVVNRWTAGDEHVYLAQQRS